MRHIERLAKPQILAEKGAVWLEKFLISGAKRPPSKQYAHPQIVERLFGMSFGKCFYCETLVNAEEHEVDHFIDVTVDPDKAFEWENLYFSCPKCNRGKPDHRCIPVETTLDPCRNTDEEIQAGITFVDEQILPAAGSAVGTNTIRKYKLNRPTLDLLRSKCLIHISKKLDGILGSLVDEGRTELNDEEKLQLKNLMQPAAPFSLMASIYITKWLRKHKFNL